MARIEDTEKKMNQEEYEQDLKRRQAEHLKNIGQVNAPFQQAWKPCLHDQCQSCHGTGVTITGAPCVHGLHCDCPKCNFSY